MLHSFSLVGFVIIIITFLLFILLIGDCYLVNLWYFFIDHRKVYFLLEKKLLWKFEKYYLVIFLDFFDLLSLFNRLENELSFN